MAKRRMFSSDITESDFFMDMSLAAQALYLHLSMNADDRGYVSRPKAIIRTIGATQSDFEELIKQRFILARANGLIIIKHWKVNNYIQKDRFIETNYTEDLESLYYDENNAYTEEPNKSPCIQNGYKMDTQVRLGKDRDSIGKNKKKKENNFNKKEQENNVAPETHENDDDFNEDEWNAMLDRIGGR